MQAWLSRYSITNTSGRLSVAPACSCFRVTFREVGDILDSVWIGGGGEISNQFMAKTDQEVCNNVP